MNGLWKTKLNGWNSKDTKRKRVSFKKVRIKRARWYVHNNKDFEKVDIVYGIDVKSYEYGRIGLDGSSGSKHRKAISKELKSLERAAVRAYIYNSDWDDVLDYRGYKNTVSWEIH